MLMTAFILCHLYFAEGKDIPVKNVKFYPNYEIAEIKIENKEFLDDSELFSSTLGYIEVMIHTHKKVFHLVLYEDDNFNEILRKTQLQSNVRGQHSLNGKYYIGALKGHNSRSFVSGFLVDHAFSGFIVIGEKEYVVEPAKFWLPDSPNSQIVMYELEDVHSMNSSSNFSSPSSWNLSYRTSNVLRNASIKSEEFDFGSNDVFCEVELVADHELYRYFHNDINLLSAYLYLHVSFADLIFRRSDFTPDVKRDSIRLSLSKISVYTSPFEANYPMNTATDIHDYMNKFVTRHQQSQYCLSIALTYRPFEGDVIGEAFRPDVRYLRRLGGICEKPIGIWPTEHHYNTAVVNVKQRHGALRPFGSSLVAFTHEIGHGFGSGHDPFEQRLCSPPGPYSKYLMHPTLLPLSKQNMEFSPCSRLEMGQIIQNRGWCLEQSPPVCGNGVREGDEECDCGHGIVCDSIDPCCTPSDDGIRGCTLKGACSARESVCCRENCTVVTAPGVQCHNSLQKPCWKSHCDGISPDCPEPEKDSVDSCEMSLKSCVGGTCNSICEYVGLKGCKCWYDLSIECVACCESKGKCVPVSAFGVTDAFDEDYVLKHGTPCNDGKFFCDGLGHCVKSSTHKYRRVWPLYASMILGVAISLGIFCLVLYGRNRIYRDTLPLLRHQERGVASNST